MAAANNAHMIDTPMTPWFLQPDAESQLQERISQGLVPKEQEEILYQLIRNGYAILPQAIPEEIIKQIHGGINNAGKNRERIVLRNNEGYFMPDAEGIVGKKKRIIDFFVPCEAALQAALAEPVTEVLASLYDEPPMAFQSLLFRYGSEQALHQDTAYVITEKPLFLTASWIALEDIQQGSGELCYYKSSHLKENQLMHGDVKAWEDVKTNHKLNEQYLEDLNQFCGERLPLETFLPKKGDVLIWLSELVHGGSPVLDEELTRKSFVTHYCPVSDRPNFFNFNKKTAYKKQYNSKTFYASRHYDLRPEADNPYPTFMGKENYAELYADCKESMPDFYYADLLPMSASGVQSWLSTAPWFGSVDFHMFGRRDYFRKSEQLIKQGLKVGQFLEMEWFEEKNLMAKLKPAINRESKFVFVLEDPCNRAFRHYVSDFTDRGRLRKKIFRPFIRPYAYVDILKPFFELVGSDNCLVLIAEEINQSPAENWEKLRDFIGVESENTPKAYEAGKQYIPRLVNSPAYDAVLNTEKGSLPVPANSVVFYTGDVRTSRVISADKVDEVSEDIKNLVKEISAFDLSIVRKKGAASVIEELEGFLGRPINAWADLDESIVLEELTDPVFDRE